MTYAASTRVPVDKTKAQISLIADRYAARIIKPERKAGHISIAVRWGPRAMEFHIPAPDPDDMRFWMTAGMRKRNPVVASIMYEREVCRLWRVLYLMVRARLEALESGIDHLEHVILPEAVLDPSKKGSTKEERYGVQRPGEPLIRAPSRKRGH